MHNSPLIQWRDFSQLTAGMIALCLSLSAFGQCPPAYFPAAGADQLLIADKATAALVDDADLAGSCPQLSADLAELYYWGNALQAPVPDRSSRYLRQLRQQDPGHAVLRRLEPAMVLLGLEDRFSREEALRRVARELDSGDALRRDKMLATVNQLANLLPLVAVLDDAVYRDREMTQSLKTASDTSGRALLLDEQRGELLLSDGSGRPQLVWMEPADIARRRIDPDAPATTPVFLASSSQGDDPRRQIWRRGAAVPSSGRLEIRFQSARGPQDIRCTATPLSANWLLTAGHCLFPPAGAEGAMLSAAGYRGENGNKTPVVEFWLHTDHREADLGRGAVERYSGSDVALLKLQRPLLSYQPATPLALAADRRQLHIDSYGYPNDKARDSLWYSHCGARLYRAARERLAPLYRLDCHSAAGQSGAVMLLPGQPGTAVGVLSARVTGDGVDMPVFSALTPSLIDDIEDLLAGRAGDLQILRQFKGQASQIALGEE